MGSVYERGWRKDLGLGGEEFLDTNRVWLTRKVVTCKVKDKKWEAHTSSAGTKRGQNGCRVHVSPSHSHRLADSICAKESGSISDYILIH